MQADESIKSLAGTVQLFCANVFCANIETRQNLKKLSYH